MKKIKLKKMCFIFLIILILILIYPSYLTIKLKAKNYSFKTSVKIIKNDLYNFAIKNDYSDTFNKAINSNSFNKENIDNYVKITYVNEKNFIENINSLIRIGYSNEKINLIYKRLKNNEIEKILDKNLINDIDKYIQYDYFVFDNLDRYLNYFKKTSDYSKTIIYVNIGLDKEYYKDSNTINKFSETMISNKYNKLDEKFIPPDLTNISTSCSRNTQSLSKIAATYFEKMCNDAKKDKIFILANSSYRSYKSQQEVYDYYYKLYGSDYVKKYVASPGYSEHQTGLAVDVASKNYSPFKSSPEYKWMLKNAYKYGFILRYPEKKEEITGYNSESWHFRYVGVDVAKYIQENNITFDEYYAIFLYNKN